MNFLIIFLELTPMHVMVILGVVLLLFGGKKIPELMKGLGSGVKEFKNAAKDDQPANSKKEEETKE
jgi:sec-independent protein translocase protein TatA